MPKAPRRLPASVPPDPRGAYRIQAAAEAAEIWIYDDIGWLGTTAKAFANELRGVDADRITVHLNSPGGDAWDGIAIYNSLRDHKAAVTVVVDGMAASAASLIAMAGDVVRMNTGAQMMVHDAAGLVIGTAEDMREFADALDKTNDSMAAVYAAKTGGAAEDWRAVMRAETWYTAAEAVEAGLADEVVEGTPAAQAKASWDLASRFRYPGRNQAPAPNLHQGRPTTPAEAARRIHAASTRKTSAADPAAEPITTTEGAAEMQFTDEERAGLRARLNLAADADDDAIKAALLAPPPATPPGNGGGGPADPPAEPPADPPAAQPRVTADGQIVIDRDAWDRQQQQIRDLQAAENRRRQAERDSVVAQAVKDGKFAPSRKEHYERAWDADPDGTRELIAGLARNVVPVAELGHAGDGVGDDAIEDAMFDNVFPPHMRLAGKVG